MDPLIDGNVDSAAATLRAWPRLEPIWRRARVVRYPHQLKAAGEIVNRLEGSALLADEVGLGKTIEAGLVLEELRARGANPPRRWRGRQIRLCDDADGGRVSWE